MRDNGSGSRRVGKKYNITPDDGSHINVEEGADFYSSRHYTGNLTDMEKLLLDYNRDRQFIKWQKRHWITPKEKPLTLPTKQLKETLSGKTNRKK